MAERAVPTTDGARAFEKVYGLDFCLKRSTISFGPAVYPPIAPPSALPKVELMISIWPWIPRSSSVPFPFFPKIPVA